MRDGGFRFARAGASALVAALTLVPATGEEPRSFTLGGLDCELIGVPASGTAVGSGTCPGVRPGAIVRTAEGRCTFNFLYSGSDGRRYIGTAGHCILGDGPISADVGERVWKTSGPSAWDSAGRAIGRFVYAVLDDPKDFALIRINTGVSTSAKVCHFGGPTGTNTTRGGPAVLHYFGNGLGADATLPARSAVAASTGNADHVYAAGLAIPGDSGAGVIDDGGRAVGVLVTTGIHYGAPTDAGLMGITRIAPQIARAASKLGIKLTLLKASY